MNFIGAPSFQTSLLQQFVNQTFAQIGFRVRHTDVATLRRMYKDVVAAFTRSQRPTLLLKQFDEGIAVHGGYYTHLQQGRPGH
jgi:hypothetical protein